MDVLLAKRDAFFMKKALQEAEKAFLEGEMPVGAVIICQGKLIAKAHNQCELLKDSSAHAEMIAMSAASTHLGSKYLSNCTLYATLEPCAMCAAAMNWAQLQHLVYALPDPQRGFNQWEKPLLHPRTTYTYGIFSDVSQRLLKQFFDKIRAKSHKK